MTPLDKHIALIHEENDLNPHGAIHDLLHAINLLLMEGKQVVAEELGSFTYLSKDLSSIQLKVIEAQERNQQEKEQ